MKKSLLTLGAVVALAAGASAQGVLGISNPSSAGWNTVTSNPLDPGNNWYSGSLTLQIYTLLSSAPVAQINTDEQSLGTVGAGIALIAADGTLQNITTSGGVTEAPSQSVLVGGGLLNSASEGTYTIGTSGTLATTASIYYALVFTGGTGGVEGAVVLTSTGSTYAPGTAQAPDQAAGLWPGNQQNVLLAPTPEPTSLALAGLGGLSMLFLRRRKA
jgi:PEP-CTERM motif